MIDYTDFREKIENYLKDNFSTVNIVFENTIPVAGEKIILSETDSSSELVEMGSNNRVVYGNLIIDIDTKYGIGTDKARSIASEISELLYSGCITGVTFKEPEFSSVGRLEGADLYRHNLVVPYTYVYGTDEINAC